MDVSSLIVVDGSSSSGELFWGFGAADAAAQTVLVRTYSAQHNMYIKTHNHSYSGLIFYTLMEQVRVMTTSGGRTQWSVAC